MGRSKGVSAPYWAWANPQANIFVQAQFSNFSELDVHGLIRARVPVAGIEFRNIIPAPSAICMYIFKG